MRKAPKSNNNNKELTKQRCCVLCRCCCCCLPVRDGQRKLPTTAERALYSFAVTRAFLSLSPCARLVATQTIAKCVLANASTFFLYLTLANFHGMILFSPLVLSFCWPVARLPLRFCFVFVRLQAVNINQMLFVNLFFSFRLSISEFVMHKIVCVCGGKKRLAMVICILYVCMYGEPSGFWNLFRFQRFLMIMISSSLSYWKQAEFTVWAKIPLSLSSLKLLTSFVL